jgi:hypothetical protein
MNVSETTHSRRAVMELSEQAISIRFSLSYKMEFIRQFKEILQRIRQTGIVIHSEGSSIFEDSAVKY